MPPPSIIVLSWLPVEAELSHWHRGCSKPGMALPGPQGSPRHRQALRALRRGKLGQPVPKGAASATCSLAPVTISADPSTTSSCLQEQQPGAYHCPPPPCPVHQSRGQAWLMLQQSTAAPLSPLLCPSEVCSGRGTAALLAQV